MTIVIMRQVMPARWQIESSSGAVIRRDITCGSVADAEDFIKRYVSSFGWGYKIITMKDKK